MLYLIPAPAHRLVLRAGHAVRLRWWRLRRPRLAGCLVLAFDRQGRLLLVRHSYGSGEWMPPGGGLGRGESAIDAGVRELFEETGCRLEGASLLALSEKDLHGASNAVNIVTGTTEDTPRADRREILEAMFFASDELPANMSAGLRRNLPGLIRAATAARRRDGAPPLPGPRGPKA